MPVDIVLLERMRGRGRVNPLSGTSFHAGSNELFFVSIALTLAEILVDCDRTCSFISACLILIGGLSPP